MNSMMVSYRLLLNGCYAKVSANFQVSNSGQVYIDVSQIIDGATGYSGTGGSISEGNCFITALKKGINYALAELRTKSIDVIIKEFHLNLVDATEWGYAYAGYQLTYLALTGSTKYQIDTKIIAIELYKNIKNIDVN